MKDTKMIYRTHLTGTQAISPFCCEFHKVQAVRLFLEPAIRQLNKWAGRNVPVSGKIMAKLQDLVTTKLREDERSSESPWLRSLAFTVYTDGYMDVVGFVVDVEVLMAYGANMDCARKAGVN